MPALEVVERLRRDRAPVALIVDEYGSISGMVTLTDVLEAIVGDIPALDDEGQPEEVQREDGSWLLDELMSVDALPEEAQHYATEGDCSWRN